MKRIIICLAVLALAGCQSQLDRVAKGEPILPVRGDVSEIELTDYLPSVDLSAIPEPEVADGVMTVGPVAIPVLPTTS